MKVSVSKAAVHLQKVDAVVFLVLKTLRKQRVAEIESLAGQSADAIDVDFKAAEGEVAVLYPQSGNGQSNGKAVSAKRIFLVGLGEKPSLDTFRKAASAAATKAKELKLAKVAFDLSDVADYAKQLSESASYLSQATTEGFLHGAYEFQMLKTDRVEAMKQGKKTTGEKKHEITELMILTDAKSFETVQHGAEVGEIIGTSQSMVRDLINQPSNYIDAVSLANAAKKSGKAHGFAVTVFDKKKITALGMGGLLGVNRGSAIPPTFSILDYKPARTNGKALPTIAIVGKGVTFDTGGISLKPADNMGDMKSDMSGAADVIGAVEVAARLKLPMRVIGIIPSTDNKTGPDAQNPGDILTTYAGITVEVDNTDAEGRLILADGLTYVKEQYNPDVIIDLATLTGACVVALGNPAAGLFSNNDDVAEQIFKAGMRSGEKVWRMPMWDDYDKQIKSDVADVKNTGGRGAGAITAAKFLEKFIGDHKAWAHIDIAGPAFASMSGSTARGSSGFGVRLLAELMRNWN
ncbi:MAG: leucyl aminopeptidase [Rhizobacter sp.]|nr:leucyl aminopeptidase [Chlorobiales bacterium]